jgi:type VI secretion system protein ImpJ
MDNAQGIYWHQGLFLQPQHFQQLELNQQYARKPLFESSSPYFWGVSDLEISTDALNNRSVEIRSACLLMRDHSFIEFPGNSVLPARSFDRVWSDMDQPLDVYLGIRKVSPVAVNVTTVDSLLDIAGVTSRWVSLSDPEEVVDLYAEGPTAAVPKIVQLVRVFFGPELASLDDYELIHVARLVRDSDTVRLQPQYIPPCYTLSGSSQLVNLLKDIRDDMAGRLRQLQEYKVPRDAQRMDLDPDYLIFLQAVQSLNRSVPAVFHLSETGSVHPWLVYGILRSVIGELSSFSERIDFLGRRDSRDEGLPPYDHENLGDCFFKAKRLVNILLNEITIGPEFLVVLELKGDYRVGQIPLEYFAKRNRFYLVTHDSGLSDRNGNDFLKEARLAFPGDLPKIIDHALPGTDLIEIANAPQGLPRKADSRYYRIEQMSEGWEAVERSGEVGLFWPEATDEFRAEIVVLRG